jgi:large-conductance mechanosensitive channel
MSEKSGARRFGWLVLAVVAGVVVPYLAIMFLGTSTARCTLAIGPEGGSCELGPFVVPPVAWVICAVGVVVAAAAIVQFVRAAR